jgi:hypothetical protein
MRFVSMVIAELAAAFVTAESASLPEGRDACLAFLSLSQLVAAETAFAWTRSVVEFEAPTLV